MNYWGIFHNLSKRMLIIKSSHKTRTSKGALIFRPQSRPARQQRDRQAHRQAADMHRMGFLHKTIILKKYFQKN